MSKVSTKVGKQFLSWWFIFGMTFHPLSIMLNLIKFQSVILPYNVPLVMFN